MKSFTKTTTRLNRKIMLILAGIVLVGGLYAVTAYAIKLFPFNTTPPSTDSSSDASKQTQEQQAADSQQKKDFIEDSDSKPGNTTTSNSSSDDQNSIVLSAEQKDSNTVIVSTKLYGFSNGTCELTITNGSNVSSQTANIIYQPEYSTCAGFSVNTASNGLGIWNVSLVATENGQSITKQVSVNVK